MVFLSSFKSVKKIPILSYLSKKEAEFYKSIPIEKRNDWLVGRFNIKKTISNYFLNNYQKYIEYKKIEILREKLKKPTYKLPVKADIKTNICISHCDGLALGAIAEDETEGLIGIDIERIRNFDHKMLQQFLLPKELGYIKKSKYCNRQLLATLFWSLKESYLKGIGTGLIYHPKFVELKMNFEKHFCELYDKGKKIPAQIEWQIFKEKYLITKINIKYE
jgi:phosphopantetheinyl transferase